MTRQRHVVLWVALVVTAAVALAVVGTERYRDRQKRSGWEADIKTIVELANIPEGAPADVVFDQVRAFIVAHSIHKIDAEFHRVRAEGGFPKALIARAIGARSEEVHMECSTRSNLMGNVLRELGYTTRTVALFDADSPKSHSFLDVLNPDTGKWESQDPDYDFYWSGADGKRVSVVEVAENPFAFAPCRGEVCGWNLAAEHGAKAVRIRELLEILTVTDKQRDIRYARYTSRAGSNKAAAFCKAQKKRCKDGLEPAPTTAPAS